MSTLAKNANDLKGPLNTSKLQTSNNAAYQVIVDLIIICADLQARIAVLEKK